MVKLCPLYLQGCLQPLSDQLLDRLYNLGALGMAFGSFEVRFILIAAVLKVGLGIHADDKKLLLLR